MTQALIAPWFSSDTLALYTSFTYLLTYLQMKSSLKLNDHGSVKVTKRSVVVLNRWKSGSSRDKKRRVLLSGERKSRATPRLTAGGRLVAGPVWVSRDAQTVRPPPARRECFISSRASWRAGAGGRWQRGRRRRDEHRWSSKKLFVTVGRTDGTSDERPSASYLSVTTHTPRGLGVYVMYVMIRNKYEEK